MDGFGLRVGVSVSAPFVLVASALAGFSLTGWALLG